MRRFVCLLLCLLFLVTSTVQGAGEFIVNSAPGKVSVKNTPVESNGRLRVKGSRLVNQKGKTVVLKGVSTHGINWFPQYVNAAAFKYLRDHWGVSCIRLALYTQEYNGYCSGGSQSALKALVKKGVKCAADLGMYVVIDWHILSDGNPRTNQKQAVSFFKEMARTYKNQKHVFYEICNEPNGSVTWNNVRSYAQTLVKTIRAYDKNNVILIGTPNWCQDVEQAAQRPLKGYANLMYTFHFYAATHGQAYRDKLDQAVRKGLPVFVSEFGICESSGSGRLDKGEANRWMKYLKKHKISYVYWSLSNKAESGSLLKSSCTKAGSFSAADLTAAGKWYKAV